MISTNKDFDGISNNSHPNTYYWAKGDTKPTNNVMNGAAGIEMDADNDAISIYFFNKTSGTWIPSGSSGSGGGESSNMLIVNYNAETKTLDKTWKEINDAPLVLLSIETVDSEEETPLIHTDTYYKDSTDMSLYESSSSGIIYIVKFRNSEGPIYFVSEYEDSYPVEEEF